MADIFKMVKDEKDRQQLDKSGLKAKIEHIHYTKLAPSNKNFYSQNNIEELADNLQLAGMIMQPLIVRRTDIGEYEVIAGHRRRLAAIMCVENRNDTRFEMVPCIILKVNDMVNTLIAQMQSQDDKTPDSDELESILLRYLMISINNTARSELTAYEQMMEAMEWKELIPQMTGDVDMRGRALRNEIAKITGKGNGTIGAYETIYNNLIPLGMERFRKEEIGVSVAEGIAGLDTEQQEQILKLDVISMRDVEALKKPAVSDSDTEVNEEESTDPEEPKIINWQQQNMDDVMDIIFDLYASEDRATTELKDICLENNEADNSLMIYELKNKFDDYLPYSNQFVDVTCPGGYEIYFNMTNEKMTVPIVQFWIAFIDKIRKIENSEIQNVENVDNCVTNCEENIDEEPDEELEEVETAPIPQVVEPKLETTEVDKEIYTLQNVKDLYRFTENRYQQLEREASGQQNSEYLIKPRRNALIELHALKLLIDHMEAEGKC